MVKRKTINRRITRLQAILAELPDEPELNSEGKHAALYGYIADTLAATIEMKRISITDIAKNTGLSRQTIHRCLQGKPITVHNLYLLAQGLGVSPIDLLPDHYIEE